MVTYFRCSRHRLKQAGVSHHIILLTFFGLAALLVHACKSVEPVTSSAKEAVTALALSAPPASVLTILHTNDTHSHFDEIDKDLFIDGQHLSTPMGGYARLSTKINQIRQELLGRWPVLLLQAGDAFQGSLYFTRMQGLVSAKMMNFMRYDAMVVGDHEFDLGSSALSGYADDINFPLLGANLDVSDDPLLKSRIKPYLILERGGEKIGIIGLVHAASSASSLQSKQTHFLDEMAAAKRYVALLRGLGIKKIVLLTHVGYEMDLKLAEQVKGVAVIIGGYSHSLLGDLAAAGLPGEGLYPTVVTQPHGRKVCIVQAWENGLAIGRLDVYFDASGFVTRCGGTLTLPVGDRAFLVNSKDGHKVPLAKRQVEKFTDFLQSHPPLELVAPDKKAAALLQPYKDVVEKFAHEKIAELTEDLPLADFLNEKNAIGEKAPVSQVASLVTKAFLWKLHEQHFDVDAALIPLSGVRMELRTGPLTVRDAYDLLPRGNSLVLVSIGKAELSAMLENAMNRVSSFPQLYGLNFTIDMRQPVGSRLSRIEVNRGGLWQPLGEFERLRLAVPSSLPAGDEGYRMEGISEVVDTGLLDNEALVDYLRHQKSISADTSSGIQWIAANKSNP